jgi:hypothetical protein
MKTHIGACHRAGELAIVALDGDRLVDWQRARVAKDDYVKIRKSIAQFAADYAGVVTTDLSIESLGWRARCPKGKASSDEAVNEAIARIPALSPLIGHGSSTLKHETSSRRRRNLALAALLALSEQTPNY